MDPTSRFRVHTSRVVGETFEDEVVLVNLDTGNYYTLDRIGADVWTWLHATPTLCELLVNISRRYEGSSEEIAAGVTGLMQQLVDEGIVERMTDAAPESLSSHSVSVPTPNGSKLLFTAPVLAKFSDMQDLLLLDPIHDVDEAGWPLRAPNNSPANKIV